MIFVIAVVIATNIQPFSLGSGTYSDYSLYTGLAHFCSGLTVGLTSLSCGLCIGITGDAGVRSVEPTTSNVVPSPAAALTPRCPRNSLKSTTTS